MLQVAIGLDIGGTKMAGGIVDFDGNILYSHTVATPAEFPDLEHDLMWLVGHMLEAASGKGDSPVEGAPFEVVGVGVAVPGSVDRNQGVAMRAANLPWQDFHICQMIEDKFGVSAKLENDADAAALGALRYAAEARGIENFVFMTIGTGVGGGIIMNGLLHGGPWPLAGEIGHIIVEPDGAQCNCGTKGCLEALASGTAIGREGTQAAKAAQKGKLWETYQEKGEVTAADVTQAADKGDELANKVLAEAGRYLAIGILNIQRLLSPQAILVGGGVVTQSDALLRAVDKAMPSLHPDFRANVLQMKGGSVSGVKGAAAIAWEEIAKKMSHKV
ncbi:MAG: ROK family protein [Firmicutes bacterium]|nr:ROK family protein [Bacillota bacterium]